MSPEKIAELLHLLRDKPEVLPALIKIYASGDQAAIDAAESLIISSAKEIESGKEASDV